MITKLQEYLTELATQNIPHSETKIEQKASRQIKESLNSLLLDIFANIGSDDIQVLRTAKGIGIAIDNEQVGFIPLELTITVKNLDYDIVEENYAYNDKLESDKAKALEKEKVKQAKIAKQQAIKAKQAELKALKDSEGE